MRTWLPTRLKYQVERLLPETGSLRPQISGGLSNEYTGSSGARE